MSSALIPTLESLTVQIAFTSDPISLTPSWVDVTDDLISGDTEYGRATETDLCEPGTLTLQLKNVDGRYDADNADGPYFGYVLPNRKVRVKAVFDGVEYFIFTGYADSWKRTWPDGFEWSVTELRCTDRMKLIARRTNTGSTVQEQAHLRVKAILDAGGMGAVHIVDSTEYDLNSDGYACRTLAELAYSRANSLNNLQEVAQSDGGALFVNGVGVVVFQSTRFRTDNTRATVSQATLGTETGHVPILPPSPAVDDRLFANYVTITDCNGNEFFATDAASVAKYGPIELDLGSSLLLAADAQDRVNDVLALRKDPSPRYDSLTVDAYAYTEAMEQAMKREISDRVTVAIIPAGQTTGSSRPQFVEGKAHSFTTSSWKTTFRLSSAGARTTIP